MVRDRGLAEEIEAARKRLEEETQRKEKEADEKLDELLSKRRMEFCPRCGRKIRSRAEWGGRCMHEGCGELVCAACWDSEEKRFCSKHTKDYVKVEEAKEEDIKNLTLNYMEFVEERMKKFGLDWTPEGLIRKTKTKSRNKKYGKFEVIVYEKRTLSKKPKIRVLVRPLTEAYEAEVNGMLEELEDEEGVYTILVFVGNSSSISQKAVKFAGEFSNKRISLFIINMENGNLHFNAREKITGKYSSWANPANIPVKFSDLLKGVAENVSGRKVVSVKNFAEEIGVSKEDASRILRESGMLEEVKDADSFIIKE